MKNRNFYSMFDVVNEDYLYMMCTTKVYEKLTALDLDFMKIESYLTSSTFYTGLMYHLHIKNTEDNLEKLQVWYDTPEPKKKRWWEKVFKNN